MTNVKILTNYEWKLEKKVKLATGKRIIKKQEVKVNGQKDIQKKIKSTVIIEKG